MDDRDYIYIQGNTGDSLNDIMKLLTGKDNYFTKDNYAGDPNKKSTNGLILNIGDYVTDAQLSMALGAVITKYGF